MFFTESITVDWLASHSNTTYVLTHIHLNMWPIKIFALHCIHQQNKGDNMSFMGN